MRKLLVIATALAGLALAPLLATAEEGIGDEPAIRGWALMQQSPAVTYEKDVVRGDVIPDTIELAEIPDFPQYGFVILNTERVIVDPTTRKVIAVY
jgi:hypothetical protein